VGVDVRPWVLGLSCFKEDVWNKLVDLTDELEERVIGQMLESELALSCVAGILYVVHSIAGAYGRIIIATYGLAENSVAIARNDLTTFEGSPDVVLNNIVRRRLASLLDHPLEPDEHFLVRQAMQRPSKTIQRGTKGEERVR
jgi:hypothetical protein